MKIGILNFDSIKNDLSRKIIHIDMDSFYASVEMRDNPNLKNVPVIMAEHPKLTNGRGVVSTCNYKAREFGVHAAMSAQKAYELCPHAIFLPVNMSYYAEISKQIREIFKRYTDIIEPLSLDEAFLDVTKNKIDAKSAMYIAKRIQYDIWKELQLTCSAGVSYNKFLAKIASDYKKPAGITTITPNDAIDFLKPLPIEKFFGVGKKSVPLLHEMGIYNGEDLYRVDGGQFVKQFGKLGYLLLLRSRGIDNSPVVSDRNRKSIGREKTYFPELLGDSHVQMAIRKQANSVSVLLKKNQLKGNIITLKVRFNNFETLSRQKKISHFINDAQLIFQTAIEIWEEMEDKEQSIRLMGVTVSGLVNIHDEPMQLDLI